MICSGSFILTCRDLVEDGKPASYWTCQHQRNLDKPSVGHCKGVSPDGLHVLSGSQGCNPYSTVDILLEWKWGDVKENMVQKYYWKV